MCLGLIWLFDVSNVCKFIKLYDFAHIFSTSSFHIDHRHTLNFAILEYPGTLGSSRKNIKLMYNIMVNQ